LHRLMREGGTVSGARLSVDPRDAEKLYSLLKRTPSVSAVSVKAVALASFWKSYGETIWISTMMLVGFASVIAFGIVYNGARIALSERGHELASLRILGYTRAEIARILLGEQGILTVLAIPLGFGLGYGLAFLTSRALARDLIRLPLVRFFEDAAERSDGDVVVVLLPQYQPRHWWERFLFNENGRRIERALLGRSDVLVAEVPYRRDL